VQVNATSGTIAWRKKDEAKKTGYGYDEYYPNKLSYDIADKKLKVVVYGLKKNSNIGTPVVEFA
jgi:hypothetical protein